MRCCKRRCFECLSFDPFSCAQNGLATPEVDVGRREIAQALVVALMVVVINERFDLDLEISWQEVVVQQDAVLQGLMPALDLALSLRVIGCSTDMSIPLSSSQSARSPEM